MDKDVVLEMISTHAVKGRTSKSSKTLEISIRIQLKFLRDLSLNRRENPSTKLWMQ